MNFVLVHGAYHGAWCWDLLRPELERAGHQVTAIDMPVSDPASAGAEYARAVIDGADWAEPQILVAHSMGGLITPSSPRHSRSRGSSSWPPSCPSPA